MLRTVLVDDEPDCIHVLRSLLKTHCPGVEIVGEADGVDSAQQVINGCTPDLLLLDIALNNENAFDLLKRVNLSDMQVIFVTAWGNHALQAIKYSAVDYLLKPADGDELCKAIDRAAKRSEEKGITEKLNALMANMSAVRSIEQK